MKDIKLKNNLEIIKNILLVFSIVIMVIIVVQNMKYSIDSDGVACALQALEMHKKNTVFLSSFHESTYIHLHTYAIWIAFFFTENLHYANIIGGLLSMVLVVCCIVLFCKYVLAKKERIFVFVFLFSYISSDYVLFYFLADYYTEFFIGQLLVLAIFVSSIDLESTLISIKDKSRFLIVLVLVAVFGLLGMRAMQYITLPLIATTFLLNWKEKSLDESVRIKNISDIIKIPLFIAMIGALAYFISFKYIEPLFNVGTDFKELTVANGIEQIFNNILSYLKYIIGNMAIPYEYKILSFKGMLALFKSAVLIIISFIFPVFQMSRYSELNIKERIFILFAITNFVITSVMLILVGGSGIDPDAYSRYLLNTIILLDISGIQFFVAHIYVINDVYKKIYAVLFLFVFICNSILSINTDTLEYENSFANYLVDNNLKYGYATFWNAGVNTYATNDSVKVRQINISEGKLSPYMWLSDDSWYNTDLYEGKSFLLLTQEELKTFCHGDLSITVLGEPDKLLTYDNYTIAIYNYNISRYFQ